MSSNKDVIGKAVSFLEELKSLLKKHDIEFHTESPLAIVMELESRAVEINISDEDYIDVGIDQIDKAIEALFGVE